MDSDSKARVFAAGASAAFAESALSPSAPAVVETAPARVPNKKVEPSGGRIIAVGGGKGGVGKSLVTSSLGISLAQHGKRVVVLDADLGGANLHTCLGLSTPRARYRTSSLDVSIRLKTWFSRPGSGTWASSVAPTIT